jgi:MarR family transcriptional regulator, lower aerobic nicotinate degradation pathway regulator
MASDRQRALVARVGESAQAYRLDEQVGFILRKAAQRHTAIFAARFDSDMTPPQWAALAKLYEQGPCPQTLLGRLVALDGATIKGIVDRLTARGLTETRADPDDARRIVVALTPLGKSETERGFAVAASISEETLAPLSTDLRRQLLELLKAIA